MVNSEIALFKQQAAKKHWEQTTRLQGIVSDAFRGVARAVEKSVKIASGDDVIIEYSVTVRLTDRRLLLNEPARIAVYPTYTAQRDPYGCGLAVLAMLTNASYAAVKAEFAPEYLEKGMTEWVMNAYLAEHGFAVAAKHPHYLPAKRQRADWPPKPFAPVHYCCMLTATHTHHYVVMLSDGNILDPATDAIMRSYGDYDAVQYVAGVAQLPLFAPDGARA